VKFTFLFIALPLFAFNTLALAQIPNYIPQNGLVGWWPFNGNANDESGNGNNLTNNNGVSFGVDRFGLLSSAASFNGQNQTLSRVNPTLFSGNSDRTISCWVNQAQPLNSEAALININNLNAPGGGCYFNSSLEASQNGYFLWRGCGDAGWVNPRSLNLWYHVVLIVSNGQPDLFVNGVLLPFNNNFSGPFNTNAVNLIVGGGQNNNGSNGLWNGKIDDIGIWNRALTQQEITALYNSCQISFSTQPSSQTISQSQTAQFSALSSDPSATYQWQSDVGFGFQNLNNVGQYSGVNTGTLSVANVSQNNNNQPFRCIVNVGTCSDTSQTATLNVCAALTSQPANQTAAANQNVQFTATSSDPSATYQWQSDIGFGFQNLSNVGQYSGVNTGTLSISNVSASNNNQPFRCVVTAGSCTDTSQTAVLSVNGNVSIEGNDDSEAFSIFPNPSRTQVTIYFGKYANKKGHSVQIVNALGQTMYSTSVSQEASLIDVSAWSANGLYYVQILDANKEVLETRKLVVQ
jgi:hypothetical protein